VLKKRFDLFLWAFKLFISKYTSQPVKGSVKDYWELMGLCVEVETNKQFAMDTQTKIICAFYHTQDHALCLTKHKQVFMYQGFAVSWWTTLCRWFAKIRLFRKNKTLYFLYRNISAKYIQRLYFAYNYNKYV